jgi:hypothetical protein
MVDDPRLRFEMQSNEPGTSSSQALSEENMFLRVSLLREPHFRTVMRRRGSGWWYLQGKEDEVKHSQCIVIEREFTSWPELDTILVRNGDGLTLLTCLCAVRQGGLIFSWCA